MDADQVLAFRLARSGLALRTARGFADAAACPASDFARDAALLALGARAERLSREAYHRAVDAGDLVVAHVVRGAIHAVAPRDFALYGRALIARDDDELGVQLGRQVRGMAAEKGFAPSQALADVTEATKDALSGDRALDKIELHVQMRSRVSANLIPWCQGCQSHHVAPMLWRYATIKAGVRLDSERRYILGKPGRTPPASEAVRRFLGFYGPARCGDFAEWAGLATSHAKRLWDEVADDLVDVEVGKTTGWLMQDDRAALESPPAAQGIRLIPPGAPYLQKTNRSLLVPEPDLRKRLFRPVASPGAVLKNGRLAGLWRVRRREPEQSSPSRRRDASRAKTSKKRPNEWRRCAEPPKRRSFSPDRVPAVIDHSAAASPPPAAANVRCVDEQILEARVSRRLLRERAKDLGRVDLALGAGWRQICGTTATMPPTYAGGC